MTTAGSPIVSGSQSSGHGNTLASAAVRRNRRRADKRTRPSVRVLVPLLLAGVVGLVMLLAFAGYLVGMRWFIISTPSMGESAPVGTLVITAPVELSELAVGDIVTFHPPSAPDQVYTHRVDSLSDAAGIRTRGDINGAVDPWTIHGQDLVGESVAVLPGVGWLIRALPMLLIGGCALWLLTRRVTDPAHRRAWRILGFSLVVSIPAVVLRPFVGLSVLTTQASSNGAEATVVSTGTLPIAVEADGGSSAHLASGEVGDISIPSLADGGQYQLASTLDLGMGGWIILGFVCALPLLGCLVVGLPPVLDEDAGSAGATA